MHWLGLFVFLLAGISCVDADDLPNSFGPRVRDVLAGTSPAPSDASDTVARPPNFAPERLSLNRLAQHLRALKPDQTLTVRGEREMRLYSAVSPGVVLVLTDEGIGSGSLIRQDGTILTNWHVVSAKSEEVGVIFKPSLEGRQLSKADVYRARIVRIDEVTDLALLKVDAIPTHARVIPLGTMDGVRVGADVHAIGHPTGESWTYTKGIISQVRRQYQWSVRGGQSHRADVIQTQTPINPGNSGGPLLNNEGQVVGVNSFKAEGEALNFAVSVEEVRRLLAATQDRLFDPGRRVSTPSAPARCEPRPLERRRSPDATLITYDLDCDGQADGVLSVPDDLTKGIILFVEGKAAGDPNVYYIDRDRDGTWDVSLYDLDRDGTPELVGLHRNGEDRPYRFEPFVASR